jgi:small subunit ribosomal protein S14
MKALLEKDKKRRTSFANKEVQRLILLYLIRNQKLPASQRLLLTLRLQQISRDSSLVRLKNRCILTNRSKGVYREFRLSRIRLREMLANGLIPGYKKAVW